MLDQLAFQLGAFGSLALNLLVLLVGNIGITIFIVQYVIGQMPGLEGP